MRLPRNRFLRVLAWLGIALAGLEVLYLLAGNIALAVCSKRFDTNAPVGVAFEHGFTWIPGRVYLRGVTVHGTANGGWSVAMKSASAAFAPWSVATSPRHVDAMTMDVTQVDIGARRSKGAIHVVATDVTIDDTRISFHVDGNVEDATLESSNVLLASSVKGTITLDVAPVDVDHQSIIDTTSGKVALDGVFLSLEPLASFGSIHTSQDQGTLHIAGTLDKGKLAASSEIRAHTAHATLKDDHGASGDFPKGMDVLVRVTPLAPAELQLAVVAPSLVFGSADASKPADLFDDFEMTVPAGSSDLKLDRLEMRSLGWTARHATIHEGASTLSATLSGQFHFQVRKDGELVADSGFIQGSKVTVENADAPDKEPFDARLVVERLAITRENGIALRGPLHASGGDARPVVDVLVTSDSIRRTVSGSIAHKAFTLDTKMNRDNAHLTLEDFVLQAGALKLRGGYTRRDADSHGAFILEDNVLPIGISLRDKKETIVVGAGASWLTRELAKP